MSAGEKERVFVLEASASPLALVTERVAAAHGLSAEAFARELRDKHLLLLQRLPPEMLNGHHHLVPLVTGAGEQWLFALSRLEVHGQRGFMLIAVLADELSGVAAAVRRVRRDLDRRAGRFPQ